MKRLLVFPILSIAFMTTISGCRYVGRGIQGSGVRKIEKRDIGAFKSIETSGAYEVRIACQQSASFEIEGDDNLLPLMKTEVRDSVLHIHNDQSYHSTKAIIVRIGVADLESFTTNGAGEIHITNVKNDRIRISSTGAADIEASGQTKMADISSTGAGNVNAEKLHAERAKISVTGAANVDVYASQQLDVTVSGVGSVTYAGNPPVVNKNVTGIGSINKKE
ncbi:MAG TPA: head GIN domain-containing protein [Pyrinomonadaceae bacterium]|jgi:hypothetical protein